MRTIATMLLALAAPAFADDVKITDAKKRDDGVIVHEVESPHQNKKTSIRVLLPTKREKDKRYSVLYILPVEPGDESRYGDGLLEVKKLGLHDKYNLICVAPTFAKLPWYADHPTDKKVAQETHFLKVVVPFVEKTYPVEAKSTARLLLGFSKSGWGAYSLLLRHPDTFGKAAAWDAPLMMDAPGKYGSGDIFGTKENFTKYQVSKLLEARAGKLGEGKRLGLFGYGNFRKEHQSAHEQMTNLKIAHEYADGPSRKHDWHSGWVAEAVVFLAK